MSDITKIIHTKKKLMQILGRRAVPADVSFWKLETHTALNVGLFSGGEKDLKCQPRTYKNAAEVFQEC